MIEGVFTKEFSRNKNDKAGVSISKGYCKDQRKRCVTERRNPAIVRMLEVAVGRLPMIKAGNFYFTAEEAGSASAWNGILKRPELSP